MAQYVYINGYTFPLNSWGQNEIMASFSIPGTEQYSDIKTAFYTNKDNIEVRTENNDIMSVLEGFTIFTSITDVGQEFVASICKEYNDTEALSIITDGARPTIFEAQEYRAKVEQIAENVVNKEESLENIWAFPNWKTGITYTVGKRVKYGNQLYRVTQEHTSQTGWEPPMARALFTPVADPMEEWPYWNQPLGSHDAYPLGFKVRYSNNPETMGYWISEVDNNTWEPGVFGWTLDHEETFSDEPTNPEEPETPVTPEEPESNEWPDWVQPTGAGDAYNQGSQVTHNSQHWISTVDNNVWEPGVYGWTTAVEE